MKITIAKFIAGLMLLTVFGAMTDPAIVMAQSSSKLASSAQQPSDIEKGESAQAGKAPQAR